MREGKGRSRGSGRERRRYVLNNRGRKKGTCRVSYTNRVDNNRGRRGPGRGQRDGRVEGRKDKSGKRGRSKSTRDVRVSEKRSK